MTPPRLWTTLPAQHHRHGKMIELLARHGASGPHAFTVLLGEAAANLQGREHRGTVEMSWAEFAHFAGIEREAAPARLHELAGEPFGLIAIDHETGLGFRVRLIRWTEWDQMPKDPTGAERSRRAREKRKAGEFDPATGVIAQRDES